MATGSSGEKRPSVPLNADDRREIGREAASAKWNVMSRPPTAQSYAEPAIGFRSRKAAQVCAWFAVQSGGTIEKLKLAKLVYLAEREHLSQFEEPMLFDEMYSLPHGPICSSALNGINGVIHEEIWDEYMTRNGNVIVAIKAFGRGELDDLSEDDIEIVSGLWARFGGYTSSQLRNYTHDHCPEYVELDSGRMPISYQDILRALGSDRAVEVEAEVAEMRRAHKTLTQMA